MSWLLLECPLSSLLMMSFVMAATKRLQKTQKRNLCPRSQTGSTNTNINTERNQTEKAGLLIEKSSDYRILIVINQ